MISIRRISALMEQYFYITIKTLDRLSDLFFWPFMSLLLWGFMSRFLQSGFEVNIIGLVIAGYMFYQFFQRCQTDIPMYLLEDFWSDTLQNIFSTPVTKWDKLMSLVLFSLLKSVIVMVFIYLVALFMFNFNLLSINPLYLALFFFSLSLFAVGIGIIVAGVIFRYGTHVQMIAWGFPFMMQPLMAVFYPVSILPLGLQMLAKIIPATYVFEGLRAVRETGVFDTGNYLISIGLNIILLMVACMIYAAGFNYNKKHGKLIHAE